MKQHILFLVKESSTREQALEELLPYLQDLYEVKEGGSLQIGGWVEESLSLEFEHVKRVDQGQGIDWEKQWAEYAQGFDGEYAHISLIGLKEPLKLKAGPGFGDCSHPTTRLMLEHMEPLVRGKVVIDVGCGSGVLSVAAALLGAKRVFGVDICLEALRHAEQNALLNGVGDRVWFGEGIKSQAIGSELVVLMNMIESEQEVAWGSLEVLHGKSASILVSGVLKDREGDYVEGVSKRGWRLERKWHQNAWSCLLFSY